MARRRVPRKTKVIATLGPACDAPPIVVDMIRAGINLARLNFSHGTHEEHRKRLEVLRDTAGRLGANVGVMIDTKGVEIRTGRLADGSVQLEVGARFALRSDGRPGDATGVSVTYPALAAEVEAGTRVLIDDGSIELRVERIEGGEIACEVVRGGRLGDSKGINVPGVALQRETLTPENRDDLLFAIEHRVDYLAASFVRNAGDVGNVREFLASHGSSIPIIAKIENGEGVRNLDSIIAAADGIMVARGDLGVEIPLQEVPVIQKRIIQATVMNGRPVITATQMLDSMERAPTPTRAEVSDVANAILDGTSAVMLSGETASGAYPVESVRTMAALALEAESALEEYGILQHQVLSEPSHAGTDAISQAAITLAHHVDAAAIVVLSESGFTARSISKYRPHSPILAVTMSEPVMRRLSINWGVTAVLFEGRRSDDAMLEFALRRGIELGYLSPGDAAVATLGVDGQPGSTNTIRVLQVPS